MLGRSANIGQNTSLHSFIVLPSAQELKLVGAVVKILMLAEVDVLGVLPSYCQCYLPSAPCCPFSGELPSTEWELLTWGGLLQPVTNDRLIRMDKKPPLLPPCG